MEFKLGFIGAGNMAEAIARAAIDHNIVAPDKIIASDPTEARRQHFESLGITVTQDNTQVITQAEQVVLAVKPQMFPNVIDDLAAHVRPDQILISIMAGIGSKKLSQMIGKPARIIRVMPNTPLLIGKGMSGIAVGQGAQPGDEALAMALFSAGGRALSIEEEQIDVITAVSGSGPAYVFYLAEAMQEAAAKLGMPEAADLLASQTLLGAATLLAQSEDSAAELRRKVTSPKGTTQAAIEHMEAEGIKQHLVDAMEKAWERSKELGQ
jgi:pyrroline-5-carboxylate reductase